MKKVLMRAAKSMTDCYELNLQPQSKAPNSRGFFMPATFDGGFHLSNNTSTEPGWLTPGSRDPDYDEALDAHLSQWISSVSGLAAEAVLPRWRGGPLLPPAKDTTWCAFGITAWSSDDNPVFSSQTDESVQFWRHETFECTASFYGPAAMTAAARFRDGIAVPQNNASLNALGFSLRDYITLTPCPELIEQTWVRRYDMTAQLRRKIVRDYAIQLLVAAPVTFSGE